MASLEAKRWHRICSVFSALAFSSLILGGPLGTPISESVPSLAVGTEPGRINDVVRFGIIPQRSDESAPPRTDAFWRHEAVAKSQPASGPQQASSVTVAGTWSYYVQDGVSLRYARFVFVELWRLESSGAVLEASVMTDELGYYRFDNVAAGTLALVFDALNLAASIQDAYGSQYAWWTGWVVVGYDWWADYVTPSTDGSRAAFAIMDNILDEALWIYERTGWDRLPVTVYWPSGSWPRSDGDRIYLPEFAPGGCVVDGCAWDRKTALHEYAHSVMYTAYGNQFPPRSGPDVHYIYTESSGGFALTEGWAEFMEGAVDNDPGPIYPNLESGYWADYLDGGWDGNIVEGAVANIFWDLFDGVDATDYPSWDESYYGDWVSGRFSDLWYVLATYRPNDLMAAWAYWIDTFGVGPDIWAVFYYGRLFTDSDYPGNPSTGTSAPPVGVWSNEVSVDICWLGASDAISGVYGYSIVWDWIASTLPDTVLDMTSTCASIDSLEGRWYLHVRTRDRAGNWNPSAFHLGPILIDNTPPSNPTLHSSDPPVAVWSNENVVYASWSGASDALSGVAGYSILWTQEANAIPDTTLDATSPGAISLRFEDGIWYLHLRTRDIAGNWNSLAYHIGPFEIDTVGPSSELIVSGTPGSNGWYKSLVRASLASWDNLGGVASISYRVDGGSWQIYAGYFGLGDGVHTVDFYGIDVAGNIEATVSETVRIDTRPPVSQISLEGSLGQSDWFASAVLITLSATDGTSGLSVIEYDLDGASWTTYAGPVGVSRDGVHTILFRAGDVAGNIQTSQSTSFNVDMTPPFVIMLTPAQGSWANETDVLVTWSGTDATSGIRRYDVVLDGGAIDVVTLAEKQFSGLAEGTHSVLIRATDMAGNFHEAILQFSVDLTGPTVEINEPTEGAILTRTPLIVRWSRTDGGSGPSSCFLVVDGQAYASVDTLTERELKMKDGRHEVRVLCNDVAGNHGEALVRFRVDTNPLSPSGPFGPALLILMIVVPALTAAFGFLATRKKRRLQPPTGH